MKHISSKGLTTQGLSAIKRPRAHIEDDKTLQENNIATIVI